MSSTLKLDLVVSVAGVVLLLLDVWGSANLIRDLDLNWDTDLSWDLSLGLVRNLLALFLNMLLALRSGWVSVASVSGFGLSVSLSVSVSMGDDLGVMTNNSGAVVNLKDYIEVITLYVLKKVFQWYKKLVINANFHAKFRVQNANCHFLSIW